MESGESEKKIEDGEKVTSRGNGEVVRRKTQNSKTETMMVNGQKTLEHECV
jgi:hypothetical protein